MDSDALARRFFLAFVIIGIAVAVLYLLSTEGGL